MANEIARLGTGGCLESLTNGALGQVLAIGAAGPEWVNASDDQTAAEVPFTSAGDLAATTVQAALVELDNEKLSLSDFCNAPDLGAIQPDNLLILRDPGTGCQIEQWLPFLGLINANAALPIATETHVQGNLFVNGGVYLGETNDILPIRASDGSIRLYKRRVGARVTFQEPAQTNVPAAAWRAVIHNASSYADGGYVYNGATGEFTVAAAGDYLVSALVSWGANQVWAVDGAGHPNGFITVLSVFINGAYYAPLAENDHYGIGANTAFRDSGGTVVRLSAGDTVGVRALHLQPGAMQLEGAVQPAGVNYFQIERL